MAGLPSNDEFSYNGVNFVGARNMRVSVVPVFDEAMRVITCQEITIYVEAYVSANDTVADMVNAMVPALGDTELGDTISRIRQLLEQRGKKLVFADSGFHRNFRVNDLADPANSTIDLKGGPFPEVLEWEPVGDTDVAKIAWTVKTYIKDGIQYQNTIANPIMAFNYEIAFDIEEGFTTRTITGYLEIVRLYKTDTITTTDGLPVSVPTQVPYSTVDQFWPSIQCEPLLGFKRRTSRRSNQDKTRLDFTIIDSQIKSRNAYPPYVTKISAKHKVSNRRLGGIGAKMYHSITAEIECSPGVDRDYTYQLFQNIVTTRQQRATKNLKAQGKQSACFVYEYEIDEDVFGFADSFSCRYWHLGTLADFLCSGLWEPVGATWERWRTSLRSSMFDPLGNVSTQHTPEYEAVISLETFTEQRIPIAGSTEAKYPTPKKLNCLCYKNKIPPPESSYLGMNQQVKAVTSNPAVRQSVVQPPIYNSQDGQSMTGTGKPGYFNQSTYPDFIQVGGAPRHTIQLIGKAIRVGYPVPKPSLQSVGGIAASSIVDGFSQFIGANLFGVPVYMASWASTYMLDNAYGQVPIPANPDQKIDSQGKSEPLCKDAQNFDGTKGK
jgi:hypothetical protein